jgi:AraC-like DNA-binding protein
MNMHIRTLERLFSTDLGLTPKELLRIRRFILLKDYVIRYQETHWTDLIVKCGFYDQAHLNHEISKVTNLTPIEFFQIARSFKN